MTRSLLRQDCRRADHSLTSQQRLFSKRRYSLPVFLKACIGVCCFAVIFSAPSTAQQDNEVRVRAREMGVAPGILTPGTYNAITDVDGVFDEDPRKNPNARLLERIFVDPATGAIQMDLNASGSSHEHDVTGGLEVSSFV